jgi:hypothetical protein
MFNDIRENDVPVRYPLSGRQPTRVSDVHSLDHARLRVLFRRRRKSERHAYSPRPTPQRLRREW